MQISKNDVGKLVTFKTPTHDVYKTSTRFIRAVTDDGGVVVVYYGCRDFIVNNYDIIKIKEAQWL